MNRQWNRHFLAVMLLLMGTPAAAGAERLVGSLPAVELPTPNGLGACLWAVEKPAPVLRMYVRGAFCAAGHRVLFSGQPFMTGEISIPGARGAQLKKVEAGPAHQTWLLSGSDGAARITASRLTPALLFELDATAIDLFAGDKFGGNHGGWCRGTLGYGRSPDPAGSAFRRTHPDYRRQFGFNMPPAVPRCFALSDGTGLRQGTLGAAEEKLAGVEKGWLLLWYGADSWGIGRKGNTEAGIYRGDAPFLLVFSQAPTVRILGAEGRGPASALRILFAQKGAKFALVPLAGYGLIDSRETQRWTAALPGPVRRKCRAWAARLSELPVEVTETWSYDEKADAALFKMSFKSVSVRPGGKRFAPLPPLAELARRNGFPLSVSMKVQDWKYTTYCGPYAGVDGTDEYTLRIVGMGKYAREARTTGPMPARRSKQLRRAQAYLDAEVDKMLEAGHLAPVFLPWKTASGWGAYWYATLRHLYSAPGHTLRVLAEAYPLLDRDRQNNVLDYLKSERGDYPPEAVPHLPPREGARRETWRLTEGFVKSGMDPSKIRQKNFHLRNRLVPAEALYDLAVYYSVAEKGKRPQDLEFDEVLSATILPWIQRRDWATLGWHGWPLDKRDAGSWGGYGFNLTRETHRQAAAAIGLYRLAQMAGDRERQTLAVTYLARTLAHRFGEAKLIPWFYASGRLHAPAGYDPQEDMRQVAMDEWEVSYGMASNQDDTVLPVWTDEEGPLACLVPETGRFLADHLRKECELFAAHSERYYPDAYLCFGTQRHTSEWWHNYPQDGRQIFLTHAWTLGKDGEWLYKHLDVPWTKVGDLYYIEKLAETVRAHRGVRWVGKF